ncbi:hypothetical protein LTT66_18200 [Nocardia gipuzkoensis]|uniref:hypothetical protein n=1 Tax=Nocardia gipuzkoensis TaxID=2749991 RepID=UPI001E5DF4DC|nr:hypothetical protein [Nocardia gipuzkoensis]UGT65302.1 hypothetical protein LTT66_18200 [Nocardia gipuzkoensis]
MSLDEVGVTPQQLHEMADAVTARYPDAILVKNQVGNLSVLDGGEFVGWLDLRFGGVDWDEDTDETETP